MHLLPFASTIQAATVHLKKAAQVNAGPSSIRLKQTTLRGGSHVIQSKINHNLSASLKDQTGTYSKEMTAMTKLTEKLKRTITYYDKLTPSEDLDGAKDALGYVIKRIHDLQSELDWLLPSLASTQYQTEEDKETYRALVKFQDDLTKLSKAANDEAATILKITRAGAGNRPDANTEDAIKRTLSNGLGLSNNESQFLNAFVEKQGGSWKEKREALSAIWALRGNQFTTLKQGKGNVYGADVEYQTTDVGKSQLWDQKTMFSDQNGFDGRLIHTHTKNFDSEKHGVGLLFDSTFENDSNYEKAWLGINKALLSGEIEVGAVKEVRAPNSDLAALHSDIYVEMSANNTQGTVEQNVKWAETKLDNKTQGVYQVIDKAKIASTNYANVANGTATTHSRYTNNRNWLPPGVYDEYAVKGGLPNEGSGRFVATEDRSEIYLTVTHYKPYTVKLANSSVVNRKAFFRII
ncbi:MAG: hypothetical protein DMF72_06335 [Acidobacteria bacterium]|nr:MAG: hypothetical protein DMF72_06335 [Acidobacteriota bacterium]